MRVEAPSTLGLSTGLVYNPAVYSDSNEIAALLRAFQEVAPGGSLFPHLRSESDSILESLGECLSACVDSHSGYCNEHSKIAGKANFSKFSKLENLLKDGSQSVPTMANMYPYTAGSTTGDALFPPEFRGESRDRFLSNLKAPDARRSMYQKIQSDTSSWDNFIYFCGGLEGIQIAGVSSTKQFLGKRLSDVVRASGVSDLASFKAFEVIFDFFLANDLQVTIISHYGHDVVVERFFRRPDMAICTDGLMPGPGQQPHPRSIGAFPRALRMAREMGIPLKEMVWRMSVLPCEFLHIESPILRKGANASLVLFDSERVQERNSFEEPLILPEGIHKVWVHGVLAMDEGQFPALGVFPGRILRRRLASARN